MLAAALLTLAKFSYGLAAALVILTIAAKNAIRNHRTPSNLPIYLLEVAALWLLAGQRLADIGPYVRNSLEIAAGYSAMQFPGPFWHVVCYAVTAAILLTALGWERWQADKWYAAFPVAAMALILFIVAKASFVRHDWWHHVTAAFVLPAFWAIVCLKVWPAVLAASCGVVLLGSVIPPVILTCPFSYASLVYLPPPQVDNWGRRLRNVSEDRKPAVGGPGFDVSF